MSEHPAPADSRRVSNFELLFDLVFVFAFTQVTGVMIRGHEADAAAALPVLEAIAVLGLLWGVWTSYGWFANQARIDRPLLRLGLALAMVFIFVAALAVPTAFHASGAGPRSAVVFVACFAAVRVLHGILFFRAADGDAWLRRQILITDWSTLPVTIAVLVVGALLGGPAQVWIWLWRIHSPSHWAERFNLVVMLALDESVISIGVGVASRPLVWQVVIGAVLSIVGAITLWWLYFHRISRGAEHALAARAGTDRVDAATVGYTYLHYPIVTGIILTATGIELTMQGSPHRHLSAGSARRRCPGRLALPGGNRVLLVEADRGVALAASRRGNRSVAGRRRRSRPPAHGGSGYRGHAGNPSERRRGPGAAATSGWGCARSGSSRTGRTAVIRRSC